MTETKLPSAPDYDVVIARGLKCRARDGVTLSVDLYRPARNGEPLPGPFPAIVTRSPYDTRSGKGPSSQSHNGEFFARHGYIYAVQDARGRFESEGEFELLNNDAEDGHDVIEWLAGLPYCDGMIGTQGSSLRAWNQNAAALERPPHLRAMWIYQGGSNGLKTALRHNGAFELRWLSWVVTNAILSQEAAADPQLQAELITNAEDMRGWLARLPWSEGNSPVSRLPNWEKWTLELYRNGDDGPFWNNRSRNFERYADQSADIPTMYAGAWYDSYARASIDNFLTFSKRLSNQYLLMGPYVHGGPNFDRRISGTVDMGPNAPIKGNLAPTRLHMMLDWFDHWLRGVDNGVEKAETVRYFRMGGDGGRNASGQLVHGGNWQSAASWPPAESAQTDLFLSGGGKLTKAEPAADGGSSILVADPENPMPTVAGNLSSMSENLKMPTRAMRTGNPIALRRLIVIQGAADQVVTEDTYTDQPLGDLADRGDVLCFETAPFESDFEITGTPEVELFMASDAPDTDVFCMIQDIYPVSGTWPEGYRLNICDSIMRVRYRDGFDAPKMMKQGEVVKVRFPLYPTSNVFAAGHRLRLLISGSSYPRFDVNPNTGEPIGRHTHTRQATNSFFHSASHPSRLILPVMPKG